MKKFCQLIIVLLWPLIVSAQKDLDITGRVSLNIVNTAYDEKSDIKPDSVQDYSKTWLIPGLQERLNIALFARTQKMDITLLGDLYNDDWTKLNEYNRVDRLSLTTRFSGNEIVLGDFFDSGSELFMQSREIRGGKVQLKFNNLWNKASFLETYVSGGIVQREYNTGDPMRGYYKQYYTAGQFRRYFGAARARVGESSLYEIGFNFLYGKDDEKSVDNSLNEPLRNLVGGVDASIELFKQKMQIFGEYYHSNKDTVTAADIEDNAYKAGIDLRLNQFKLRTYFQRIGYDYYTTGYPYLLNDRQGVFLESIWQKPDMVMVMMEGEYYKDNLKDNAWYPKTTTREVELGFTTQFKNVPEFTLKGRFRDDLSDMILNPDSVNLKTDKVSKTVETSVAHNFENHRLMLSMIYVDFEDHSLLPAGTPLGTDQLIGNFNFYTRPVSSLFISGGLVYSALNLTNNQENTSLIVYESSRWELIPRRLVFETNLNLALNDASGYDGYQDMLSNYRQLAIEFSFEYFFNSYFSVKAIGGTDGRTMDYSREEALKVIADPDYGPAYFNGYESYNGFKYGAEFNWIF
ncbi:MAG: hypothetical protein JXR46_09290 [Calditrichaceae bacterium]|nr:hypothetical protein [Calditrichaceae bacterium]MBN2709225.1 hypothetical protein [Calditrichaceae bacterium]RQV96178.1 MAG: hypothetical protein EH224_05600 [Calditrichota bacterium]